MSESARDDSGLSCDWLCCPFSSARSERELLQHQEREHGLQPRADLHDDYDVLYACRHCPFRTDDDRQLQRHFRDRHWPQKWAADRAKRRGTEQQQQQQQQQLEQNGPAPNKIDPLDVAAAAGSSSDFYVLPDGGDAADADAGSVRVVCRDLSQLHACPFCHLTTHSADRLEQHLADAHRRPLANDSGANSDAQSTDQWLSCDRCDYRTDDPRGLASHATNVHCRMDPCDYCDSVLPDKESLLRHIKSTHPEHARLDPSTGERRKKPASASSTDVTPVPSGTSLGDRHAGRPRRKASLGVARVVDNIRGIKQETVDGLKEDPDKVDEMAMEERGEEEKKPRPARKKRAVGPKKRARASKVEEVEEEKEVEEDVENKQGEPRGVKTKRKEKVSSQVDGPPYELRVNEDQESFTCSECYLPTTSRPAMHKHVRLEHGRPVLHCCSQCPQKTESLAAFRAHVRSVHEKLRPFACGHCDYKAGTKSVLRGHMLTDHPGTLGVKILDCPHCHLKFKMPNRLRYHIKCRHTEKKLSCQHCGWRASVQSDMNNHVRLRHGVGWLDGAKDGAKNGAAGPSPPIHCDDCGEVFPRLSLLHKHRATRHSTARPFLCDMCGYSTTYGDYLKKHKATVHRERACDVCDFKTNIKADYDAHVNTAHVAVAQPTAAPPPKGVCPICGLKPARAKYLPEHIRSVHEKVRRFACDKCDFRASTRTVLKFHVQGVHDKLKNVACPEQGCTYRTFLQSHLRSHLRTHQNIRRMPCAVVGCGFVAMHRNELVKHKKDVHTMRGVSAAAEAAASIVVEEETNEPETLYI